MYEPIGDSHSRNEKEYLDQDLSPIISVYQPVAYFNSFDNFNNSEPSGSILSQIDYYIGHMVVTHNDSKKTMTKTYCQYTDKSDNQTRIVLIKMIID
ncbi:hypothetical protein PPL_12162 [Heterostelium album PN500]|uniref:Uncharacterized protein n=1 Tax=Heterostelium pallidum (strain ATCC 26659 / Pp 5 / PN500) TaxID=670386 RepID=D3BLV8_HETP5|nr:hypothetical protein PPL_12162 [Heterostelium album PN500]EFA77559.1 hypothetical protein PPL_12162 [Heterostelium album PN500]|eukprot:XP_020429687.1 hypothetical protein PPL_12162 [Heterostelium album PN500]